MEKIFVLDTNVLLHDTQAILRFQDNHVILPLAVIEELDRFKKQQDVIGQAARQVSRFLDQLRQQGKLTEGIHLENGGSLTVRPCPQNLELPQELAGHLADNVILAIALEEQSRSNAQVIIVSKDINLRIKADVLGLLAEDYATDKVNVERIYHEAVQVFATSQEMNALFAEGCLSLEEESFYANQTVTLVDRAQPSHTALAVADSKGEKLLPLKKISTKTGISRIQPRNREQQFALQLLLQPEISLLTLIGQAGTGKTLLAIAAGLHQVADLKLYQRLLVSRPIVAMGNELGYLPGELSEKLNPWMQPIYDNFDLIFGTQDPPKKNQAAWQRGHEELLEMGLLQIEPLTYIRGRSIPRQFLVVDEAQNLTPHEIKTILTRAGEGTKIVLTGDPEQIDNPYVDAASNGLTYVAERFKGEAIAAHVTLLKGERSLLSERAAALL